MTRAGSQIMPNPLPGPGAGQERVPTADETRLIQWTFDIDENGYGPTTRQAVRALQQQNGIPVDPDVTIGPRTWQLIMAQYNLKARAHAKPLPSPLAGPQNGQERLPTPDETRLIQWTFDIHEDGYGPSTRQAVQALQQKNGIPVDPDGTIGPRTWQLILAQYSAPALAELARFWQVPAEPYQLTGNTLPEVYLAARIDALNRSIPEQACLYVRNRQIVAMKRAGNSPTGRIALPAVDDPQVQQCIVQLTWNQNKVNQLWQQAITSNLDPRIMLAVLIQEGTGSFDTNAEVPTYIPAGNGYLQGGSGVQPDFALDLAHAMDQHILAKIRAYGQYGDAFRAAVVAADLGDGNVFQYVNYNVPWIKTSGWTVTPGCYATDTQWWKGLQRFFDGLVLPGATAIFSAHWVHQPPAGAPPAPHVRFVLTYRGTGSVETITNQPWIEAQPG